MPRKTATNDPAALNMSDIFGPGGMLEKVHPGYEFRSSQLEMAEMVAEAFEKRQHTIVEAGTGTGKTLAYLVPALRSGRRGTLYDVTDKNERERIEIIVE